MTAAAMSQDRERCMAAGMNDHVAKPFERRQLISVLAQWVKVPIGGRLEDAGLSGDGAGLAPLSGLAQVADVSATEDRLDPAQMLAELRKQLDMTALVGTEFLNELARSLAGVVPHARVTALVEGIERFDYTGALSLLDELAADIENRV
jgi:hypothetical protein